MLLPALAKAREKARSISCVNNLNGCTLAVIMYGSDYNDNLCITLSRSKGEVSGYNYPMWYWGDVMSAYKYFAETPSNAQCPSYKNGSPRQADGYLEYTYGASSDGWHTNGQFYSRYGGYSAGSNVYACYTSAGAVSGYWVGGGQVRIVHAGRAVNPSQLILLFDCCNPTTQKMRANLDQTAGISFHHDARANFSFVDGHVESLLAKQCYALMGSTKDYNPDGIPNVRACYGGDAAISLLKNL